MSTIKRSSLLPDMPTVVRVGTQGFDANNWYGLLAPAKTPRPIINRLNAEVTKVLNMPDVKQFLFNQGLDAAPGTPEEFGAYIKSETAKWAKVIRSRHQGRLSKDIVKPGRRWRLRSGWAACAGAQAYPAKAVRMVVPFPAGGTNDLFGRLLAEHMTAAFKQQIVVDNRGGSNGVIGAEAGAGRSVARAIPGGYTIGFHSSPLRRRDRLRSTLRGRDFRDPQLARRRGGGLVRSGRGGGKGGGWDRDGLEGRGDVMWGRVGEAGGGVGVGGTGRTSES